ncbi:unnamed protein product, partial [Medioppia subpectinata]
MYTSPSLTNTNQLMADKRALRLSQTPALLVLKVCQRVRQWFAPLIVETRDRKQLTIWFVRCRVTGQ